MNVITSGHEQDSKYSSRPKGRLKAAGRPGQCQVPRRCNSLFTCNTDSRLGDNTRAAPLLKEALTGQEKRRRRGLAKAPAASAVRPQVDSPDSKMPPDSKHQNVIAKRASCRCGQKQAVTSSTIVLAVLTTIGFGCSAAWPLQQTAAASSASQPNQLNEYQLVGQARDQARLPCLIGKQAFCGEPYFIAWYKLNATSRLWTRIEAKSRNEQRDSYETLAAHPGETRAEVAPGVTVSRPLADRVQLVGWSRDSPSIANCLVPATGGSSYSGQTVSLFKQQQQQPKTGQLNLAAYGQLFDCAQLTISSLELADEGQYKCEVTFSESLDFDRCPASTMTQLNVIARPNEPEILLNGRPIQAQAQVQSQDPKRQRAPSVPTFKEGAQVRLECQSSGGKPSPRIEWLNLTTGADRALPNEQQPLANERLNDNDQSMMMMGAPTGNIKPEPELQLMRAFWPIKRATYFTSLPSGADTQAGQAQNSSQQQQQSHQVPVTSSSITITVSRYDLRSRFICLVLPQQQANMNSPQRQPTSIGAAAGTGSEVPASVRQPSQLAALLDQVPMLSATNLAGSLDGPMLKWVKLNVLAKPTSASMQVIDVATNALVRPSQQAALWNGPESPAKDGQQQQQPFYSLQPNRLYAIQCLVENSRPRSQVAWFNRTSPIGVPIQLDSADYLVPNASARPSNSNSSDRPSSFTRFVEQSGTFRTTSSLLLTTSYYDHFEELYCRISNEAFQFDELAQVAPILAAKIYVNYPPSVWLEAAGQLDERPVKWSGNGKLGRLVGELGRRVQLRCVVGASPLLQNTILQIEWLKDGRRVQVAPPPLAVTGGQQQQEARIVIEKANHLHIPQLAGSGQHQAELSPLDLLRSSYAGVGALQQSAPAPPPTSARLLAASSLTIGALNKSDAGLYSCQYKLIPAPATSNQNQQAQAASQSQPQLQLQQQMKILSGRANQSIKLTVIEAKLPVLRIASSSGLLVYEKLVKMPASKRPIGKAQQPPNLAANYRGQQQEVVVAESRAELSLKCDFRMGNEARAPLELGHKVIWYLDGVFLHASSSEDVYNLTWDSRAGSDQWKRISDNNGGRLTCAHQLLESSSAANFHADSMRLHTSANSIQLRFKLEPRLVPTPARRDLMPSLRSFNELELNSQPANKLKLVCLAQCEPLCSIDWLINKRPLVQVGQDVGEDSTPDGSRSDHAYVSARRLSLAGDDTLSLAQIEIQTHGKQLNRSADVFSWRKQTSLVPSNELQLGPAQSGLVASQLDVASKQLLRDAHELQAALGEQTANVFSKLELNYNQLSQLLSAPPQVNESGDRTESARHESNAADSGDAELLIECKLSKLLDGQQEQQQLRRSRFGHAHVPARVWFPSQQSFDGRRAESGKLPPSDDDDGDYVTDESALNVIDAGGTINEHELNNPNALSLEPLNLTSLLGAPGQSGTVDALQTKVVLETSRPTDQRKHNLPCVQRPRNSGAPKRIYISLAGSRQPLSEIQLNEEQLGELLSDEEAPADDRVLPVGPTLRCQTPGGGQSIQYKWTFSSDALGLGASELLVEPNKQDLNLKHLASLRRRQIDRAQASSMDANQRLSLMVNIFGSYTCHASNSYELVSTSLSLKYQGRPMCKLTAEPRAPVPGSEQRGPSSALRCHIYSSPKLLETIWLQDNGQAATNMTRPAADSSRTPFQPIVDWFSVSAAKLATDDRPPTPIFRTISGEQQQKQAFSVAELPRAAHESASGDLAASSLRCVARNSIGCSDACKLESATDSPDWQAKLDANKNNFALPASAAKGASLNLLQANISQQLDAIGGVGRGEPNYQEGQLNAPKMPAAQEPTVRSWLARHLDWLLIGACFLLLFGFVAVFGAPLLGCRLPLTPGRAKSASHTFATRKSRKFRFNSASTASLKQHQQPWRFQSASRASSANEIGLFANNGTVKFHAANSSGGQSCFYGGVGGVGPNSDSNGGTDSSEHDMVQSCSQSSHYEDFIRHQLQQRLAAAQQQQQQQGLYFKQPIESTTLSRRPLVKSSLSCPSAEQSGCTTTFRQPIHSRLYGDNRVAQPDQSGASATTRSSNVPLVSGAHNTSSRIQISSSNACPQSRQLERQPDDGGQHHTLKGRAGHGGQFNHANQTGAQQLHQQEHIYDDIIYNRMLL